MANIITILNDQLNMIYHHLSNLPNNSSCSHAITVLLDAVRFNRRKTLRLYLAAIDATKAFDKGNRQILLSKLIDKIEHLTKSNNKLL